MQVNSTRELFSFDAAKQASTQTQIMMQVLVIFWECHVKKGLRSSLGPLRWRFLIDNLLPWTEVQGRDVATLSEFGPWCVFEGLFWHFSDTSVVTDDASKWRLLQGLPLGLSEDSCVLPPKTEINMFKSEVKTTFSTLLVHISQLFIFCLLFPYRSPWRIFWNWVAIRQANRGPTLPPRTRGSDAAPSHTSMFLVVL